MNTWRPSWRAVTRPAVFLLQPATAGPVDLLITVERDPHHAGRAPGNLELVVDTTDRATRVHGERANADVLAERTIDADDGTVAVHVTEPRRYLRVHANPAARTSWIVRAGLH